MTIEINQRKYTNENGPEWEKSTGKKARLRYTPWGGSENKGGYVIIQGEEQELFGERWRSTTSAERINISPGMTRRVGGKLIKGS